MQTVTLQAEDFKTIHNTLCELRSVQERITGVVNNEIADRIHRVIKGFEAGLKDAYAQDDAIFSSKMDYYHNFKSTNGLRAIWSVYELPVHGFLQDHPYPADSFVVYVDHWGEGRKHYPVQGPTWGDVYRAADLAIRESGDDHHVFIEHFTLENGNELRLSTGS